MSGDRTQRHKEIYPLFDPSKRLFCKGINELSYRALQGQGEFASMNNAYSDERGLVYARPGTTHSELEDGKAILQWKTIFIEHKGLCIVAEKLDTATGLKGVYYTTSLDYPSGQAASNWTLIYEASSTSTDMYPFRFLEFRGRLWITNGVDPVQVWDGSAVRELSDKFCMRGRVIFKFMNRIWFADTPESPYNLIRNRFVNDYGQSVEPGQEDAWDASMTNSFPQMMHIVGCREQSPQIMQVHSKGGIFALYFNEDGDLTGIRKTFDISCVEGNYFESKYPLAFDEDRKGYYYTGSKWEEIKAVKDTIADNTNCPFELSTQVFVRTKEEFDQGHYLEAGGSESTTAEWKKDILTVKPLTTNHLIGESQQSQKYPDIAVTLFKYTNLEYAVGQSITVEEWGDWEKRNIGKKLTKIETYLANDSGSSQIAEYAILEYDAPPHRFGEGRYKVLSTGETASIGAGAHGWKLATMSPNVVLELGKKYYLAVRVKGAGGELKWHYCDDDVYEGGELYHQGPTGTDQSAGGPGGKIERLKDATFKIYYAGATTGSNCYYTSPVYQDPLITAHTQGRLVSAPYFLPVRGASENLSVSLQVRARATSFNWDDGEAGALPDWIVVDQQDGSLTESLSGCLIADLATGADRFEEFFQFRICLLTGNNYKTPEVYAVREHYQTQAGEVGTHEREDKLYLMFKNVMLMHSPAGWYKVADRSGEGVQKLMTDSMIFWNGYFWGATGEDLNDSKYYFLQFDEIEIRDQLPAGNREITITLATGDLDCGYPEHDKVFRRIWITTDQNYKEPVPWLLQYKTDRKSNTEDPGAFSGTVCGTKQKVWEHPFPKDTIGKYLQLIRMQVEARYVRKIKLIEIEFELRRKGQSPAV